MARSRLAIPADLPRLTARAADAHKNDFGHALLVGGSVGMTGAICLSSTAALRSGAGLVHVAVPRPCLPIVASYEPSYMTAGFASDDAGRFSSAARPEIIHLAERATSVGCGPGLGRSPDLVALVHALYTSFECPAVFDADALNALSEHADVLDRPPAPRVLTPHPGELMRLLKLEAKLARDELERRATQLALDAGVVVVLKGHRTLITDGQRAFHNSTGNPGMATGGTGDVLTGIIAALLSQFESPLDAARLGVFVHGLAGDLAAAELGQVSLVASDLLRFLPAAWQKLPSARSRPSKRSTRDIKRRARR